MMDDTFESYLGIRPPPNDEHRRSSNILDSHLSPQLSLESSASGGHQAAASDFSLDDLEGMFDWDHSSHHFPSPSSSSTLSPPTDHLLQHDDMSAEAQKAFGANGYFHPSAPIVYENCFAEPFSLTGPMPGIAIPATPLADGPITSLSPSSSASSTSPPTWHLPTFPAAAATALAAADNSQPQMLDRDDRSPLIKRKRTSSGNLDFWQLEPSQQIKKVAHNAIERRYRTNINDRINDLKNVVPALYKAKVGDKNDDDLGDSDEDSGGQEVVDGIEVAKKLNKATILRKATEYILFLRRNNELLDRENQILQHIINQMPGGQQVLNEFLAQKREFHQREQDRLARERKEARVREQLQRQELLKERAAQRAALAQLLPKRERRPYRRRKKSEDQPQQQNKKKSAAANNTGDQGPNRMFMALYMCVAFFSASPFDRAGSSNPSALHHPHQQNSRIAYDITSGNQNDTTPPFGSSLHTSFFHGSNTWIWFQIVMYAVGFLYFFLLPWLNRAPHSTKKKLHHLHHHYAAAKVESSWDQLVSMSHSPMGLVYETVYDMLSFLPSILTPSRVSKTELNDAAAWTRLCEMQCLGADPSLTRLQLLRSCAGMLSRIHLIKREPGLVTAHTLKRVNTAAAIQLELAVGKNPVSRYLSPRHPTDQVMAMLRARNGGGCPNIFYSFVLPYLVTPLDWTAYWTALANLQSKYTRWIMMPSDNSIFDTTTSSAVPSMIAWWIHLGACLKETVPAESLQFLETLIDKDDECLSFVLLKRHCRSIFHLVKAASESDRLVLAEHLEQGLADVSASADCVKYLSPPVDSTSNAEADLLHVSTLAVHMYVYRRLTLSSDKSLDRFRRLLRAQISREMESKVVPDECREVIETVL